MKCFFLIGLLQITVCSLNAQEIGFGTDTIGKKSSSENIYSRHLFSDSLASTFFIVIKKEVKPHKHLEHSENVVVLEGEGNMKLGERELKIRKGDVVFIPKNTVHSVKSIGKEPLKVISVQAPFFDGKDRIMID
ncbi:MAG TPA: cupin domain-containing protein [Bacteroidia bacterium]|nr:cupin domain-containing protein [Bacteroidia bacterium]